MSAVALPCPFCGCAEGLCATVFGDGDSGTYQCPRCDATGPAVSIPWRPAPRRGLVLNAAETWENRALAMWNDRFRAPPTPFGEFIREIATAAQGEAKAYSDRGLLEAIYILLRRNELAQQNAADIASGRT